MKILQIRVPLQGMLLLSSAASVQEFIESVTFQRKGVFKVGDFSLFSDQALSCFLKFLEESIVDFIGYASSDNLPAVLLSRFDKIVKKPLDSPGLGPFQAFMELEEGTPRGLYETSVAHLNDYYQYISLPWSIRERVSFLFRG